MKIRTGPEEARTGDQKILRRAEEQAPKKWEE
jgi:hypothetical protein